MVDKLFIMLKEFDVLKDGTLKIVQYDTSKPVEEWYKDDAEMARRARNNAIVDIARAILAHPSTSHQINTPGNYDTLGIEADRNLIMRKHFADWAIAKGFLTEDAYAEALEYSTRANVPLILSTDVREKTINSIQNASADDISDFLDKDEKDPLDIETFAYYHNQNMTGGKLIGIYANNNTAQAKYQQSKIAVGKDYEFVINGHHVKSLSAKERVLPDGTKVLISQMCAEFSAASVDNVKDPKLANMMQNPDNAFVTGTMLRMGMTIPEISAMFSIFANENTPFPTSLNEAISRFKSIDSYDAKLKKFIEPGNTKVRSGNFTTTDIYRTAQAYERIKRIPVDDRGNIMYRMGIESGLISKEEWESYQATGDVFLKIMTVAPEIKTLTSISRADSPNGAVSNTLAGAINQVMKVMDFHARQYAFNIIEGTEGLMRANAFNTAQVNGISTDGIDADMVIRELFSGKFDMPMLQGFFSLGIQGALQTSSSLFKQLNPVFLSYINDLRVESSLKNLPDKIIDRFLKESVMFYLADSDMFGDVEKERVRYIFDYPKYFASVKNSAVLSKYSVIRTMEISNGYISIEKLPRMKGIRDTFSRELLSMLLSKETLPNGEAVSKVAIDLLKYSYFTDGLGWRVGGFSNLFTPTFLETLPQYMQALRNMNFNDTTSLKVFYEQFIRRKDVATKIFKTLAINPERPLDFSADGNSVTIPLNRVKNIKNANTSFEYICIEEDLYTTSLWHKVGIKEIQTDKGVVDCVIYARTSMISQRIPMYNPKSTTDGIMANLKSKADEISAANAAQQMTTQMPKANMTKVEFKQKDSDPNAQKNIDMEEYYAQQAAMEAQAMEDNQVIDAETEALAKESAKNAGLASGLITFLKNLAESGRKSGNNNKC